MFEEIKSVLDRYEKSGWTDDDLDFAHNFALYMAIAFNNSFKIEFTKKFAKILLDIVE